MQRCNLLYIFVVIALLDKCPISFENSIIIIYLLDIIIESQIFWKPGSLTLMFSYLLNRTYIQEKMYKLYRNINYSEEEVKETRNNQDNFNLEKSRRKK